MEALQKGMRKPLRVMGMFLMSVNITCNKTLNVCSLLYVNSISKILKGKNQKAGNSPGIA